MSGFRADVTPDDVVQFVENNTTPGSRWISGEEIVWVLSWYGETESKEVRGALKLAVDGDRLVVENGQYTTPELARRRKSIAQR